MDDVQNVPAHEDENGMSPTPVEETDKLEEEMPAEGDAMPEAQADEAAQA